MFLLRIQITFSLFEYTIYVTCRSCDLIGRLPLYLHGNNEQRCDHDQLNGTINGHLLLQKAGLLVPTLETMVSGSKLKTVHAHTT